MDGSPPAIGDDGTIYLAGFTEFIALNKDGSVKWINNKIGVEGFGKAISIDDNGNLYVVWSKFKKSSVLIKFNKNGMIVWKLDLGKTEQYGTSSPAISENGLIYVGTSSGKLLCITSEGKIKWTFESTGPIYSSPVIGDDGVIYFTTASNKLENRNITALQPDGTKKWINKLGGFNASSPVIADDGTIYVGSDCLYAFDSTGKLKWKFNKTNYHNRYQETFMIRSTPIIDKQGTIFFSHYYGEIVAVNSDGSQKWIVKTNAPIDSSPALSKEGKLHVTAGKTLLSIGDTEPIKDLIVTPDSISLGLNDSVAFHAYATLKNNKKLDVTENVTWWNSSIQLSEIDSKGILYTKDGIGEQIIIANYKGKTKGIKLNIEEKELKSINFDDDELRVPLGTKTPVTLQVEYDDGSKRDIVSDSIISSSDESVVEIENGFIIPKTLGTANVIAKFNNNETKMTVEVVNKNEMTNLVVDKKSLTLTKESNYQLRLEAIYQDGSREDVTSLAEWSSTKPTIAKVEKGLITALKKGKATIKVKFNSKTLNLSVTVK